MTIRHPSDYAAVAALSFLPANTHYKKPHIHYVLMLRIFSCQQRCSAIVA